MKKLRFIFLLSISLLSLQSCFAVDAPTSTAAPMSHDAWDKLLKKHVSDKGVVSYTGFKKDQIALKAYTDLLASNAPNDKWSKDEKLTYWINAYNAFTVQLIVNHLDKKIKSIKDITGISIPLVNSPWDIKFIKIGDKTMDLNQIEHGIIRKQFTEARIHFALVCAAKSCPSLRNEAYDAAKLNAQLDDQAVIFLNDATKNKVSKSDIKLSPIFNWYEGDFTAKMPLKDWAAKYAKTKPEGVQKVSFLDYDWALNGK
jgi:Protein of unknown function, DUF547